MTKEEMIYRIDLVADTQRTKIVGDPARTPPQLAQSLLVNRQ